MMETATPDALALRNGTTVAHDITIAASDDSLALDTVSARMHFRARQKATEPLLALDTDGDPTANGSTLSIVSATAAELVLRLRLVPADTAALPYGRDLGSDLELVYPSGDVARPLRIFWTTDGEYTHG